MTQRNLALAGMIAALSGIDSMVAPAPSFDSSPAQAYRSQGHGSRAGNKPQRDYAHEKRRRQIARASRQLNRRRAA